MAFTLGIDLDINQVRLCLIHVEGPNQTPKVEWLIFGIPFNFGANYFCEFGSGLFDTIANFLYIRNVSPKQINKVYFVCGMPYSAFESFESGLHYTANVFIQSMFDPERVGFIRADGKPYTPKEILNIKGSHASAFVATQFYGGAYLVSKLSKRNNVLVDIGVRESHIIPIQKSIIDPIGRSKVFKNLKYRLSNYQSIPYGALFTPVAQINKSVTLKRKTYLFNSRQCRMGVVAQLLKLIDSDIAVEHDLPLPAERDAHIQLARAIGMDLSCITKTDLHAIAQSLLESFSKQLGESINHVIKTQNKKFSKEVDIYASGIAGSQFLNPAIKYINSPKTKLVVKHMQELLPHRLHEATGAYGAALYALERLMDESYHPGNVEAFN